jgi:hypothetical protein
MADEDDGFTIMPIVFGEAAIQLCRRRKKPMKRFVGVDGSPRWASHGELGTLIITAAKAVSLQVTRSPGRRPTTPGRTQVMRRSRARIAPILIVTVRDTAKLRLARAKRASCEEVTIKA